MERTIKIEKYYTCMDYMLKKFDKYKRQNRLKADTIEEYEAWKKQTTTMLWSLLGLDKMELCPLLPKIEERVMTEENIIREKIIIQVEPDVWMPVYILIPVDYTSQQKRKCIIAPPGHGGAGKYSVAGVKEIPIVEDRINFYNYAYGVQLAKMGYVVLCNDARGFGERRELAVQGEEENKFIGNSCFQLAHMAESLGQTAAGMYTWDLMRLIDYIEERKEWDVESIGCVGFSGGGMQSLWLSVFEKRIKYAIISGYFYGYRDSLLKLNNNCSCNYIPHLWEHVDMGDIGALLAPKPVVIQSCTQDHLNGERGIINVLEQMDIMKKAYKLYKKEHYVIHDICPGGHKWHEENIEQYLKEIHRFLENEK